MPDENSLEYFKNLKNYLLLQEFQTLEKACQEKIKIPPDKVNNLDQYTNKLQKIKEVIEELKTCSYGEGAFELLKELKRDILTTKHNLDDLTQNITDPNKTNDIVQPLLNKALALKEKLQAIQSQLNEFNKIKKDIEKKIFSFSISPNHAAKKLAVLALKDELAHIENSIKEGRIKDLKNEVYPVLANKLLRISAESKLVRQQSFLSRSLRLPSWLGRRAHQLIKQLHKNIPNIGIADNINPINFPPETVNDPHTIYLLAKRTGNPNILEIVCCRKNETDQIINETLKFIFNKDKQKWERIDTLKNQDAIALTKKAAGVSKKNWLKSHQAEMHDLFISASEALNKALPIKNNKITYVMIREFSYDISYNHDYGTETNIKIGESIEARYPIPNEPILPALSKEMTLPDSPSEAPSKKPHSK